MEKTSLILTQMNVCVVLVAGGAVLMLLGNVEAPGLPAEKESCGWKRCGRDEYCNVRRRCSQCSNYCNDIYHEEHCPAACDDYKKRRRLSTTTPPVTTTTTASPITSQGDVPNPSISKPRPSLSTIAIAVAVAVTLGIVAIVCLGIKLTRSWRRKRQTQRADQQQPGSGPTNDDEEMTLMQASNPASSAHTESSTLEIPAPDSHQDVSQDQSTDDPPDGQHLTESLTSGDLSRRSSSSEGPPRRDSDQSQVTEVTPVKEQSYDPNRDHPCP